MKLFVLICCLIPVSLFAADATKPHNHKGIIKPYVSEPPKVELTKEELARVSAGTPIFKQTEAGDGGRAVAVFMVNAPEKTIWEVLSDIESYPKWISNLDNAKVYKRDGGKIFAEFTIKVWPTTTTYFIEHHYPANMKGCGTWTLDYSRLSDLDESVGFWRVAPVQDNPEKSIVYYSVDIQVKGFLSFLKGFIVDKGLKEATQWVKVASETSFAKVQKAAVSEKNTAALTTTSGPNNNAL